MRQPDKHVSERNALREALEKIEQQLDYGQNDVALELARAALASSSDQS